MLSKNLNINHRCSTYCGWGLKEEHAGKYLSGGPRPPSQNVDFAQFLVGSGILSGWRCPQPESRDPLTPLKDTTGTNVGWQWYYHRVVDLPNPIVETRSPLRKAHWNRFWSWPLCLQGFYNKLLEVAVFTSKVQLPYSSNSNSIDVRSTFSRKFNGNSKLRLIL